MPRVTRSLNQGATVSNWTQQLLTPWSDTVTPCVRGDPDRDWWPVVDIKGEVWKNLEGSDKSLSDPPPDTPSVCVVQLVVTTSPDQRQVQAGEIIVGQKWSNKGTRDTRGHGRGQISEGCSVCYRECSFVWGHSMLWFSKDGQSMPRVHQDLIFHSKWIISYSILYLVCPYSRSWGRSQQWGSANLNNPFILIHLWLNKVPAFFFSWPWGETGVSETKE